MHFSLESNVTDGEQLDDFQTEESINDEFDMHRTTTVDRQSHYFTLRSILLEY